MRGRKLDLVGSRAEERAGRLAVPGEMRLVSPVVEVERVDLIERIARLALALKHEPLAVRRPVALAGAPSLDRQPADARQEIATRDLPEAPARRRGVRPRQSRTDAGRRRLTAQNSMAFHRAKGSIDSCGCRRFRGLSVRDWIIADRRRPRHRLLVVMVLIWTRTPRRGHLPAEPRRRRNDVLRRDGAGVVPARRAAQDVPIEQISPYFKDAVISIEDHRYYIALRHRSDCRQAAPRSSTCGPSEGTQGGSTITQQLARTLYLSNARTFARKAQEAALAVMLESFSARRRSSSCISIACT